MSSRGSRLAAVRSLTERSPTPHDTTRVAELIVLTLVAVLPLSLLLIYVVLAVVYGFVSVGAWSGLGWVLVSWKSMSESARARSHARRAPHVAHPI